MRICLLSQEYFPTMGGTGRYAKNLSKGLAKQGCEVHIVTIAAEGMQPVFYEAENICIHAVPCPKWPMTYQYLIFSRKACKIVRELCKNNEVDIVHGNIPLLPDYKISRQDIGKPIIDAVHSTYLKEREYIMDEPISSLNPREILLKYVPSIYISKEKYVMRRADKLIAVSNHVKRQITQLYQIPEDKIVVVKNGIDTSFFDPTRKFEEVRSKYMVGDSRLILYLGRFYPKVKGLFYLLQAMPQVLKKAPDTKLIVAGRGDSRKYADLLDRRRMQEHVIFTGYLHDNELLGWLSAADIFVLPSLYEGGTGTFTIYEAMAMEKPVVVSRIDGVVEVVKHRENGLLFEAGNSVELAEAIMELLQNEGLTRTLKKRARETVLENYTFEKMANETLKIYKQVSNE